MFLDKKLPKLTLFNELQSFFTPIFQGARSISRYFSAMDNIGTLDEFSIPKVLQ